MEIYNGTGKTKTGELRVTRAIGGFLLTSSRSIDALTNERISIFIEKANGTNTQICNNVNLKHFILASTYGATSVQAYNETGLSAICEIATNGVIPLASNESIKISLDGLLSTATYSIDALEYPQAGESIISLHRKTILSEEIQRPFDVNGFDFMMIDKEKITSIKFTYSNGQQIEYSKKVLEAIAFDVESVITIGQSFTSTETGGVLMYPLSEVTSMEVNKEAGVIELTLFTDNLA